MVCCSYFGAFNDSVLKSFYDNLSNWELDAVIASLADAGITSPSVGSNSRSLSVAPPAVAYHIFCNPHIIRDARISKIVRYGLPGQIIGTWPTDYPPPCLFYLLVDEREDVRQWASEQLGSCKAAAMPADRFSLSYRTVLKMITSVVSGQAGGRDAEGLDPNFSQDSSVLWSGYAIILRYVPSDYLRPQKCLDLDIRRVVTSHLHDTGSSQSLLTLCCSWLIIPSRHCMYTSRAQCLCRLCGRTESIPSHPLPDWPQCMGRRRVGIPSSHLQFYQGQLAIS